MAGIKLGSKGAAGGVVDLSPIEGVGFNTATDSLRAASVSLALISGVGFNTVTDSLRAISAAIAAIVIGGADPLSVVVPGAYGVGTVGRRIGDYLDAAVSGRAVPGDAMALTPAERLIVQALLLSDATPFAGALIDAAISSRAPSATALSTAIWTNAMAADLANYTAAKAAFLNAAISSRAVAGDAMALTPAERLIIQALILSDATPFPGARIDATISSRSTLTQAQILSDATPFPGARIDATVSSRSATGEAAAALAANAYTRQAGVMQEKATTIDLNQAAATYDLFTGTTQPLMLFSLVIRMSGGAVGGALTSISIQTDDATPQVLITAIQGAVANLTNEAQLYWSGQTAYLKVGKKIQLTINGGAAGVARVCDVVCEYRSVVTGGFLS